MDSSRENTPIATSNQDSSNKARTRKLLEEAGAVHVQLTGSILIPLSKEQREAMQISAQEKTSKG